MFLEAFELVKEKYKDVIEEYEKGNKTLMELEVELQVYDIGIVFFPDEITASQLHSIHQMVTDEE